ncbi:MAG: hypothetical protein WBG90_21935 [Saonia sp.]
MKIEKITFSKASKLLGVYDKKGRDTICIEYENFSKDKPWITLNDWLWGKLQKMVLDTKGAPEVYWMMSQFVSRFEGKSGLLYDRLAIEARLKQDKLKLENDRIEWVAEVIGDPKCTYGIEMDGRQFPLEGDFNPAKLACKNCQKIRCLCMYSIVGERDSNGRLIWKSLK